MDRTALTPPQWILVHVLAANLANQKVSKNLVLGLRDYLSDHPNEAPDDYLRQLVALGDAFAGGQDDLRQRKTLQQVIRQVGKDMNQVDWPLVLSWVARLIVAYRPEPRHGQPRETDKQIQARIKIMLNQNLTQLEGNYYG